MPNDLTVRDDGREYMNTKAEQVGGNSATDIAKLVLAGLVLAAGVFAYYWYNDWATWQRILVLLGALIAAGAIGFFTRLGHALRDFLVESNFELRKVVWPTRKEAGQMTGLVFAFVVIMALFLWSADKLIEWVIFSLVLGWK